METKFYVFNLGYMEMDESFLVLHSHVASIRNPQRPAVWAKSPVLSFLVVHPEVKVLFDAGCDPLGMSEHWHPVLRSLFPYYGKEEERIENRLAGVGLKPEDIDIVVASHLHNDHAGNLNLFPKAKILVHPAELSYALLMTRVKPQTILPYTLAYAKHDFESESLNWELVEDDFEIAPGLEIITLGGHTPGILGMVVHLKETGTLICPSDAIYCRRNYGPPPRLPGNFYDSLGFFKTVSKVQQLQRRYKAKIFYPHDFEQAAKEMIPSPQYYA